MTDSKAIASIDLPFPRFKSGKVREVYCLNDQLLIVSTDRLSAFDYILPTLIPDKGKVLTRLSSFWFHQTRERIPNHLVTDAPHELESLKPFREQLEGRAVLARKLDVFPVEAIVRGYLAGSMWETYRNEGQICGEVLPKGLKFADQLPEPVFTPSTKAESGHDENISFKEMESRVGSENARRIRQMALELYAFGSRVAREKGIIIADTKFEFGRDTDGQIILVDEIFTPDSSRFWRSEEYRSSRAAGSEPPPFDKQFVRNFLLQSGWDRNSPPPPLPDEVVEHTRNKYLQILQILTGKSL
ncbi:MAG: phosphoribosylaminoimidazolesuccinocarboxamide synthase [Acidobacteriota bacterium]|jgi:phosphoribosylaminoimidazole-succinocarboxamide synthase|nr:phosphoribosylaminoimidazolesuccinocarboxamide synthase [Acidobacteriota bacterium]